MPMEMTGKTLIPSSMQMKSGMKMFGKNESSGTVPSDSLNQAGLLWGYKWPAKMSQVGFFVEPRGFLA